MSSKPTASNGNTESDASSRKAPSIYDSARARARDPWRRKHTAREPGARKRRVSARRKGSWVKPVFVAMVILYALGATGFIVQQWRERRAADRALRERKPAVWTPVAPPAGNTNLTVLLSDLRNAEQLAARMDHALDTEQIDLAVEEVSRAANPMETVAFLRQYARLLAAEDRLEIADRYYRRGARMDPFREPLIEEWIGVNERLGKNEEALQIAEWFVENRPDAFRMHRTAARLCSALGRPREAAAHLERYIAEYTMDVEAREALAENYIMTERWGEAEELLKRSIELAMQTDANYRMLLQTYCAQRKNAEIFQTVRRASVLFGRNRVNEWLTDPQLEHAHQLLGEQWVQREQMRVEQERERRRKQPQLLDLQIEEGLLFKE